MRKPPSAEFDAAPKVYGTKWREERHSNQECFYCNRLTELGKWVRRNHPDLVRYMGYTPLEDKGEGYRPSEREFTHALRELDKVDEREAFAVINTHQRKTVARRTDQQGRVYWECNDVITTYLARVCPRCFQTEAARAEADEQGWRYCLLSGERCRCGRTKPRVLEYCVRCTQELRLLEGRLAAAKFNRRLIRQIEERLRHAKEAQ